MEATNKQLGVEYQQFSLMEFLLGCHGIAGWLEAYSVRNHSRTTDAQQQVALENHAAAA